MTIVQQAIEQVPGFEAFHQKFLRRMAINDRARSTSNSYGRSLASISLHFNRLPVELSQDEIDDYLYSIREQASGEWDNYFRFAVHSLRFAFKMEGLGELRLQLPVIRRKRKLPVVLSKAEIGRMIQAPYLLKHRVLIALLYGCGLRCSEVRNIKVVDIDLQRRVLHVRQGKGNKDRVMPLGELLPGIIEKYLRIQKPDTWLFPGQRWGTESRFFTVFEPAYGKRSIQWAIGRAAKLAGIIKRVNVHCLRHTYATHLLEDGVNILTIKELLGHAHIKTTMIYLHVAQVDNRQKRCPLDSLDNLHVIGYEQGELKFG